MRGFARVSRREQGYDTDQVDEFFTRARDVDGGVTESDVREVAFDLVAAGYDPEQVDLALDRLEESHTRRRRHEAMASGGPDAWRAHVAELEETLRPRLERPAKQRFVRPGTTGYSASSVDSFLGRVSDALDGTDDLTADEVRAVTFPPAQGRGAYAEGVVDAYLDRVVEVLLARA
ncbi:MAG: DivIVA domain-containing protein [Actinomycetaceae bacterium]